MLSGYRDNFITDPYSYRLQLVYWMKAWKDTGYEGLPRPAMAGAYPSGASHAGFLASETPAVGLFALDEKDEPFQFRLESIPGNDAGPFSMEILAPSGKTVVQQSLQTEREGRRLRYIGENALEFPVPKDGEKGLYFLDIRTYWSLFKPPFTTLPHEGILIHPGRMMRTIGGTHLFLAPVRETSSLQFDFNSQVYRTRNNPLRVQVSDAEGKEIIHTVLLAGSKRASALAKIDAMQYPPPWEVYLSGVSSFTVSGTETQLIASTTAESAAGIARAWAKKAGNQADQ